MEPLMNSSKLTNTLEWPNTCAFMVLLSSTYVKPHSTTHPMRKLQLALEKRLPPHERLAKGKRDQRIIGAAQVIVWDGQELFKHVLALYFDDDEPGLKLIMRHNWRDGFKEVLEESVLTEKFRKIA
ncbi:hypothetical protein N7490_011264 [Penicillium lividum]|nr:hypothetical protein N7490_011264 [Penicillium lividum]